RELKDQLITEAHVQRSQAEFGPEALVWTEGPRAKSRGRLDRKRGRLRSSQVPDPHRPNQPVLAVLHRQNEMAADEPVRDVPSGSIVLEKRRKKFARIRVPHSRQIALARSQNLPAIAAEVSIENGGFVRERTRQQRCAQGHIPDLNRLIRAPTHQAAPVGTEMDRGDGLTMNQWRGEWLS